MKTTMTFSSALAPLLTRYMELQQALGRCYRRERAVLQSLDRCLGGTGADLTGETFLGWCQTQAHISPTVRRNRMRIIRNFCRYRRRTEPVCFVPDPVLFPAPHPPAPPYIFSESEIVRLLRACDALPKASQSPLRPAVYRLAVVLLYTAGLRSRELVRLTLGDYDARERTLLIRASKFYKSRLLPLPDDVAGEVARYLRAYQDKRASLAPESPLLWNRYNGGRGYSGHGLGGGFRTLFRIVGIHHPDGRLPHPHDFRHSFAVQALIRWYHAGVDVQSRLPFLAAYMGHVSIVSTQYYLHFIEPLATLASQRLAHHYGNLITPHKKQKGVPL